MTNRNNGFSCDIAETVINVLSEKKEELYKAILQTIKNSIYLSNTNSNHYYECVINKDQDIIVRYLDRKGIYEDLHNKEVYLVYRKEVEGLDEDENQEYFLFDQMSPNEKTSFKNWAVSNSYLEEFDDIEELIGKINIFEMAKEWDYVKGSKIQEAYLDYWYDLLDIEGTANEVMSEFENGLVAELSESA